MQTLSKYFTLFPAAFFTVLLFSLPAKTAPHHNHGPLKYAEHNDPGNPPRPAQSIVERFSRLVRANESEITKYIRLYRFIDEWFGTPYLWSGCTKRGIDCSCFVQKLYNEVFDIRINRTSLMQFCKDVVLFTNREQFQLGDLVFFKTPIRRETKNNRVTHVGFYLTNGYFVQSSSSGVNIASLNSAYWKNYFVAAGRLKDVYYKRAGAIMPSGQVDNNQALDVEEAPSVFDPILYPEDVDSINSEYSRILNIEKEEIEIPEIFQFIEKNRYAPFNINNRCMKKSGDNSCFLSTMLKDVFNYEMENSSLDSFLASYAGWLGDNYKDTILDIIKFTRKEKNKNILGIYLHNGYFLYLDGKDISVATINNMIAAGYVKKSYRIKRQLSNTIYQNLRDLRKNGGALPDSLRSETTLDPPENNSKHDSLSATTPPAVPGEMGPPVMPALEDPAKPAKTKPAANKRKKTKKRTR